MSSVRLFDAETPEERAVYERAILALGLTVTESDADDGGVAVKRTACAIVVHFTDQGPPLLLSRSISPGDLAAVLCLVVQLDELRRRRSSVAESGTVDLKVLAGCRTRLPAPVDLNVVVSELLPTLLKLAGSKVRVLTKLLAPLPPARIDRLELERVLLNLVANARDATPHGGDVVISTGTLRAPDRDAATGPTGAWVTLDVEDQGIGMDESTMVRAFEPFFTTKPADEGTGLGLAGVMRAVRAASGDVHLHSELGRGTRVQVLLPIPPEDGAGARSEEGHVQAG